MNNMHRLILKGAKHYQNGTIQFVLQNKNYFNLFCDNSFQGNQHPDRDQQFQFMERKTRAFQKTNQPVISVDAKKKENLGQYRNPGREWRPVGDPELVNMHDFPDKNQSKGLPYGVYDVQENTGWVSVGTDHDTAKFAVETIRR